jgi:phospholipase/carboxylesterase
MQNDIIIQRPNRSPAQLILLFHGVGGSPHDLVSLGQQIAGTYDQAMIVSVAGSSAYDENPSGFQWFSINGITEENRVQRAAGAMPDFVRRVRDWQNEAGLQAQQTALIGFSQGAIMVLEATQLRVPVSGRSVAIAGRFSAPPQIAPGEQTLHLIHGENDITIPYSHTLESAKKLIHLGADVTADVVPLVGHNITAEIAQLALRRLYEYRPARVWVEALQSA